MTDTSGPRVGVAYEAERADALTKVGSAQHERRVDIGGLWALLFHDASTLRVAVEESLRARRVTAAADADADADAASALVPPRGSVAAVLLVDAVDAAALADRVTALAETLPSVHLEVAGHRVTAAAHAPAAAMPILFALDDSDRAALRAGATVAVAVDHPSAPARVALSAAQRDALAALAEA